MAMNCECTGFLFQDVLLLVGLKQRTGELVLESGNNIGCIIFHKGRILQAFSPYSRAIGDLLVEDGLIADEELLDILLEQKKSGISPIGTLFLKTGKVSFEVIEMMVHEQIRQAIKEFSGWQKLRVSFVEKLITPFDKISLPVHDFISPETLLSTDAFFSMMRDQKENESQVKPAPASF